MPFLSISLPNSIKKELKEKRYAITHQEVQSIVVEKYDVILGNETLTIVASNCVINTAMTILNVTNLFLDKIIL